MNTGSSLFTKRNPNRGNERERNQSSLRFFLFIYDLLAKDGLAALSTSIV